MNNKYTNILLVLIIQLTVHVDIFAQASLIRKPFQEIYEATTKYIGKHSSLDVAKELNKLGGEEVIHEIAERTLKEGGEETLSSLVNLTGKYGPDLLISVKDAPNIPRLLKSLDGLPEDTIPQAIRRLSAGDEGIKLLKIVDNYGTPALSAELKHPGIGANLISSLGKDGIEITSRLNTNALIAIARQVDDINKLPSNQKEGLLKLLREYPEKTAAFIAQFIKDNPKSVLFTVASTTIILRNSDKIFGGGYQLTKDENGNPVLIPKIGLIERAINKIISYLLPIISIGLIIYIILQLYYIYKYLSLKNIHNVNSFTKRNSSKNKKN